MQIPSFRKVSQEQEQEQHQEQEQEQLLNF